jgi:hypothetical protein
MLAVCLTGEQRWPALTLANLQHLLMSRVPTRTRRTYWVGPSDASNPEVDRIVETLLTRLGVVSRRDVCTYDPNIRWVWGASNAVGEPSGPFDMTYDGKPTCTAMQAEPMESRQQPLRLLLNARWLPEFKQCSGAYAYGTRYSHWRPDLPSGMGRNEQRDSFDLQRSRPCKLAVSLVMQLWQSRQCLELIRAAEARGGSGADALYHRAILRVRPDLLMFPPIVLPQPSTAHGTRWYTLFESSCDLKAATRPAGYGERNKRFIQDFWLYGSRQVMDVALVRPLVNLLENGLKHVRSWRCGQEYADSMAKRSSTSASTASNVTTASAASRCVPRSAPARTRSRTSLITHPQYSLHPLPHVLHEHFDDATDCLKAYNQRHALLRVNVAERCYSVQARVFGYWRNLGEAPPLPTRHGAGHGQWWLNKGQETFLRSIARVYHRCFGLVANASCPRVVGDLTLTLPRDAEGRYAGGLKGEAPCLRNPANGSCRFIGNLLPTATAMVHGIGHGDPLQSRKYSSGSAEAGPRSQEAGFECVLEGLAT